MPVAEAPVITNGFSGIGRFVALLHHVMFRYLGDAKAIEDLSALPHFLAFPDPAERHIDVGVANDDDAEEERVVRLGRAAVERALKPLGKPFNAGNFQFFGGGETAFAKALGRAKSALEDGSTKSCIVGAVDSLVSEDVLELLSAANALKSPENQYGLVPGEGAVVMLLETSSDSRTENSISVRSVTKADKVDSRLVRGDGAAIANTIIDALNIASIDTEGFIVASDMNGERERAIEWGDALVHLAETGIVHRLRNTLTPASSLGSAGVASSAMNTALATHALMRKLVNDVIVITDSAFDYGECSAIVITAA